MVHHTSDADPRPEPQRPPEDGLWRELLFSLCDEGPDEEALLARLFVEVVKTGYNVLSLKTYRLDLSGVRGIPITPCLDHEAQIHEHELPHVGGYLQHWESGSIISFAYFPLKREIWIEEESGDLPEELDELAQFFRERFPLHQIDIHRIREGSAYARARDVAEAHLPLVDVLLGEDADDLQAQLSRLNGIATLMEKQSRVSSWGIRTAYPPLTAAFAFVLILFFPSTGDRISSWFWGDWARVGLLLLFGGAFLYWGLKAVQLTKTATRLNKRIREYEFILDTQKRLREGKGNLRPCSGSVDCGDLDEEGQAALQEALELLSSSPTESERLARLVKNRHRSAALVLDAPEDIDAYTPLFRSICSLRLAAIRSQRRSIEKSLEQINHLCHKPQHIAARASQRRLLVTLDQKARLLQAHLSGKASGSLPASP